VTGLTPGSAAESAGVKVGDLIERVDGKPIQSLSGLVDIVRNGGGKPVELGLSRDGQAVTLTVTPQFKTGPDGAMRFMIGVQSDPDSPNARFKVETIYHGPVTAFSKAVGDTWFIISKVMEFFGQLFTGTGDYRQLSGPIGIAKVSSDVAQVSLAGLINLIAVLSVSIGLLNLLPIPILDGGHLLYYAIEGIRGRPLGERAQEFGFRIGLVFVLGLMAVATFNDIVKVAARIFGPAA
jgi:regulator of sigma E protease